jgi:carboxyl-terminal processing protease
MKYFSSFKILFFGLFILVSPNVFCQTKYQKIEIFIKVWGFLKYHHPAVANGRLDWDSVYLNNLPAIQRTTSANEFNKKMLFIINTLGPLQRNNPVKLTDNVFTQNHDMQWVDNSKYINMELRGKLKEIYTFHNQGPNKYISRPESTADYSGENKYENMAFPSENYRLLFLSRFWNAINYFAPYKYLIGEDWNNVLSRFIPKIMKARDTLTYYKALLQLTVSLHDGHAQLTNNETSINDLVFGKYTAPIYVTIVDGAVIIRKTGNDSLCNKANIQKGDIILSVNNVPIEQKIAKLRPYISASNNSAKNEYLSRELFDTHDTYQQLKIKRGNKTFTVKVKCMPTSEKNWGDICNYTANNTGYKVMGNSIAYVYAMQVWLGNMDTIKALIKSKKAVIFDGRNYQNNGDIFYSLFDIFLPEPKAINMSTLMLPNDPGYFKWKPSGKIGGINKTPYKGKVIILVDERAQSQGEYTAMALQTIPNAVTIGSQTAGHDGVATAIPMGGKLTISYSGYGIYYPDKTPTQRRGIKIDMPVNKTVKGSIKGQDEILEKALKYLKERGID